MRITSINQAAKAGPNSFNENTDLITGILSIRIWATLGWHDIRQRYRRSVLGPFWFTMSTAIMVVVLGLLYSTLLNQEISQYLPYLASGLVIWQYLSSSIMEGCTSLINATYLIKQIRLPLTLHVCRIAWRNFAILLHSLPVVLVLLITFGHRPGMELLLLPISLFILHLHGIWIGVVLGIIGSRFRDVPPIVVNLVQIAFFFTPILWSPDILKDRAWVAEYNPLHHLIDIVRAPIIGQTIQASSWAWSIGMLLLGFAFAQFLLSRYRNRIPYWL